MSGRKANKKINFRVMQTKISILKKLFADGGFGIFFSYSGNEVHLSVHLDRKDRVRIHLNVNNKIEDIIFETNNKEEYLKKMLKEIEDVMLTDRTSQIPLFEIKESIQSEVKRINTVNAEIECPGELEINAIEVDENYIKTIVDLGHCADLSKPINWRNRANHDLLADKDNNLYLIHEGGAYLITKEKLMSLFDTLKKFTKSEKLEEKITEYVQDSLSTNIE
ncbi:MAG: hypothetical protein V1776_04670 [Candidatus Diapherotrites archaeon]